MPPSPRVLSLAAALLLATLSTYAATEVPVPPAPVIPAATFNITSYGAVGDGKTMNTAAFAAAIAACQQAGGGSVIVPPGRFLTGPIVLVSHMALVVQKDATIQASSRFADFGLPDPLPTNQDQLNALRGTLHSLISGDKLTDVAIRGQGTIDGAGAPWWARTSRPAYNLTEAPLIPRPNLVVIQRCDRLEISGVTLCNSPQFHLVPKLCNGVLVDGIKIKSPANAQNTDAIDPSNCRNMLIRNVVTDGGDDNVAFKAGGGGPSGPITVEDCTFKHGHGVSIGSETDGGISNILVQRCTFEDTDSAIRIKSNRSKGGLIQDIVYRDLKMKNVGTAIFINFFYEDKAGAADIQPRPVTNKTPLVRDILISNIQCEAAHRAGEITGLPEASATNIVLENVSISAWTGLTIQDTRGLTFKNVSITTSPKPADADSQPVAATSTPAPSIPPQVLASGSATVALDGSADFHTIHEALAAASSIAAPGRPFIIHVKGGTYKEVVIVPKSKGPISLIGESASTTIITFANGASTLDAAGNQLGTFQSATAFINADNFTAENITFENSFGKGSQALAVNIGGDRDIFRACRFLGWQDTILVRQGRQYFDNCEITGVTDFIFGAATSWFEKCHIHCLAKGYITAANTPQDQPYGYIFSHCAITAEPGVVTYLGRPWRPYAAVTFLDTDMSAVIAPEGWHEWNKTDNAGTTRYAEYNSTGPGATPATRVSWSKQLTAEEAKQITLPTVLTGWNPTNQ